MFEEIAHPSTPRSQSRFLHDTDVNETEDLAVQSYWKEFYVGSFDDIISSLKERIASPLVQVFNHMEKLLLVGVTNPFVDQSKSLRIIKKYYGKRIREHEPPISQREFKQNNVIPQLQTLRREWIRKKGKESKPKTYEDITDFITASLASGEKTEQEWWNEVPTLMKLLCLISVAAGTSSFAERTFSLARRLMTWTRAHMDEEKFDNIGILGWYKDDLNDILDLVKVANEWVDEKQTRFSKFGRFTEEDLKIRDFEL